MSKPTSERNYQNVTAASLRKAWEKYRDNFGEDPHGTLPQLGALLEFLGSDHLAYPQLTTTWQNIRSGRLVKVVDFSDRNVKVEFVSGHTRWYRLADFQNFFRPESEILRGRR